MIDKQRRLLLQGSLTAGALGVAIGAGLLILDMFTYKETD